MNTKNRILQTIIIANQKLDLNILSDHLFISTLPVLQAGVKRVMLSTKGIGRHNIIPDINLSIYIDTT